MRLSIDTAKRRAHEDAEERAAAADWVGGFVLILGGFALF